jgi:DNA mismatch repair protein MutL
MSKPTPRPVRRLPDSVVNKIAAGEVVERPASVLKELVENSLDAGARRIEIAVEAGGKNFIQVLDDGAGMSPGDARLALERHATSKLSQIEDLDEVATLGFRGEALPSIAAVSRFELRTRRAEDPEGLQLWVADGVLQDEAPAGGPVGTRITVRNLFFSTPARRKFLAGNQTELRHLLQLLRRTALLRPEVHFIFVSDGEELHDWPPGDLGQRVGQVFGAELLPRLIAVEAGGPGLGLRGFVGKVNTFRRSYGDQYLFVNGRPVQNRMINHAVFSAYGHTLQRDQLPFYLLFLELERRSVDVNVHPAKREVRFADERGVHGLVNRAVRAAMTRQPVTNFDLNPQGAGVDARTGDARPQGVAGAERQGAPPPEGGRLFGLDGRPRNPGGETLELRPPDYSRQASLFREGIRELGAERGVQEYLRSATLARERFEAPRDGLLEVDDAPLFQLHRTYILAQVESGVMIVDQHVAHERILFEQCLTALSGRRGASQRLLFPLPLDLGEEDRLLFEEVHADLIGLGFELEMAGGQVQVVGLPAALREVHPEGLVREVLDQFRIYASAMPDPHEALAAAVACKAAIKAGQPLSQTEMRSLLAELFTCRQPFTCPHGRPVVVNLGLEELHRRFDRG